MEYVEGTNLRELIAAGSLTPASSFRIFSGICDAVQYAHDQGVVHRDIKPENVLIDAGGVAKVADFGLAKVSRESDSSAACLTGSRTALGSAHYAAPEQIDATAEVDHRADIYSLGIVLYEMLTGALPTLENRRPSLKARVDRRFDAIVERATLEAPGDRYQQARDLKQDLPRPERPASRRQSVWALAVAVVLLLATGLGVALRRWPGPVDVDTGEEAARHQPAWEPSPEMTQLTNGWWLGEPVNLGAPVNSEFHEQHPSVTADGLLMAFGSNRPSPGGSRTLWGAARASTEAPWSEPYLLVPNENGAVPTEPSLCKRFTAKPEPKSSLTACFWGQKRILTAWGRRGTHRFGR